ncbi:MAG: hypothetical protein C4321_10730, partial [Chloroflexota bacterium]
MANWDLLAELCTTPGTSGREERLRALVKREFTTLVEETRVDALGNVVGRRGRSGQRLMIAAHMDEIGFLVRHINDEGYLYFAPVGGWDAEIVIGQRVFVHTATGRVEGVIGKRAIHLMDAADRDKRSELHTLWIDI